MKDFFKKHPFGSDEEKAVYMIYDEICDAKEKLERGDPSYIKELIEADQMLHDFFEEKGINAQNKREYLTRVYPQPQPYYEIEPRYNPYNVNPYYGPGYIPGYRDRDGRGRDWDRDGRDWDRDGRGRDGRDWRDRDDRDRDGRDGRDRDGRYPGGQPMPGQQGRDGRMDYDRGRTSWGQPTRSPYDTGQPRPNPMAPQTGQSPQQPGQQSGQSGQSGHGGTGQSGR